MSTNGMAGDKGSPNDDTSSTSKRRRIVFSCLSCRRRKLKCDRIFPSCGRCQKGGHPDSCAYDSEAVEFGLPKSSADRTSSGGNTGLIRAIPRLPSVARSFAADEGDDDSPKEQPPEDAPSSLSAPDEHIRQLEARIIGLEKAIHGSRSQWLGLARSPELARTERMQASEQRETAMNETMIFRGKNFKTQYFGASHHTSQLSHIGSLRIFMKDMIVQHPQLAQVQREVHGNKIKEHGQNDGIPANDSTLVELLPQRNVADELVRIYISNFETTHRILHLPTFWAEYHPLWNAPHQSRPAFVALVLLILATTHCIRGNEPAMFRGDSSVKRETAITWVRQCDSWLDSQSHKHVTITIFQLHCLSFIAKQMNAIKRKRTWISAGNLLRLAMSAGLHRDAQIINLRHATPSRQKVSVFDQEMRRRIWATVLELELQAATERGMPAMTRDLLEDCGAPSNLEDEEFDQSTERLPNPRPITQYTRSSYQHLSRSSWSLRSELLSLINGLNPQLPYEEVLRYDKKIMQVLDDIPQWNVEEGLVAQTLLQLQAQQLLLFLYRPYARDGTWGSRYDYSAIVHLRSAMKILDLHYRLASNGNSFLHLYRNDVLGAALSICYNVSLSDPEPERRLASRSLIVQLNGDPVHYLEKALSMLEEKIMCLGVGLQEYYCVSAISGLLRKRLVLENTQNEEHVAADRVTAILQKVLALQDNYSAAATLASLPNMPIMATNGASGMSNGNGVTSTAPMDNSEFLEDFDQNLEGLDLTNIAGWDLDAFWNF